MLFPTIEFAVFFAVVFPVTWLLNAHNTWKKVFLVAQRAEPEDKGDERRHAGRAGSRRWNSATTKRRWQ